MRSSDSVLARLGRLADFVLAPAAIAGSGSVGIAEGCMVLASCKAAHRHLQNVAVQKKACLRDVPAQHCAASDCGTMRHTA